ncbi:MAG: glycosyltransferase, partial [Verrucomicrobiota bacterium]|nr:glycosyltransferase [Verrucomicrobiota bacterium]
MMTVDLIIPILNEEEQLWNTVSVLHRTREQWPFTTVIKIVDNGSTDGSAKIGSRLSQTIPGVDFTSIKDKGRG